MEKFKEIAEAIKKGKAGEVETLTQKAIEEGYAPMSILNDGMVATMEVIGNRFKEGEIFVPEMLVAARAMKKGVAALKPHIQGGNSMTVGKCIIGTVEGDMHDIGKNIVAIMMESNGFEVVDLGVDVKSEKFVTAVKANPDAKVVALSCLLTTTMPEMGCCVKALKESGLKGFKILVGGAPITQEFADRIGADAYGEDAADAGRISKSFV